MKNDYINLHEGYFPQKWMLDQFKAGLSPECKILREDEPMEGITDEWHIIYWQPESIIDSLTSK